MKLTLHIGLHKTGTTFLQRQFIRQSEQLAQQGWLFPQTGFTDHSSQAAKSEATPGHQGIVNAALAGNARLRKKLLQEIESARCENVLISCENLSFPFLLPEQRAMRMEKIRSFFSNFKNIEIIAVLRRPDSYLESLYRERVVSLETRESRTAMHFAESVSSCVLNFSEMLDPWRELSSNSLRLFSYEALRDQSDYLSAFAGELGIVLNTSQESHKKIYSSPGRQSIELVRLANALGGSDALHRATLSPFLQAAAHYENTTPNLSVLSPLFRESLLDIVQASSQGFLAQFGLNWDFNAMRAQIDAEKSTWSPMDNINTKLVETYASFGQTAHDLRKSKGLAQAVRRVILKPGIRDPLLRVYGALPDRGKQLARSFYSRWGR